MLAATEEVATAEVAAAEALTSDDAEDGRRRVGVAAAAAAELRDGEYRAECKGA